MLPKFWIAARCLTITFWRAMCAAPAGERDGGDHRQELGRQARRRAPPRRAATRAASRCSSDADQQDEEHEEEHRPHDEERELPRAALELGLGRPRRQARGDVAERGRRPRRDDQRRRRPAHDRRAEEDDVARVRRLARRDLEVARVLLGRHRLARERRLLDVEVARLEEARVGGHAGRRPPAGRRRRAPARAAESRSRSRRGGRSPSARRRRAALGDALRAVGLNEVEHHTQHHHERR